MLSDVEKRVRSILKRVARDIEETHHHRKITYKELWLKIHPNSAWGRGHTAEVVGWIVNISDRDVGIGVPPLNSLVVRKDTGQPGEDWDSWHREAGSPYESLAHAQAACWAYWPARSVVAQFQTRGSV